LSIKWNESLIKDQLISSKSGVYVMASPKNYSLVIKHLPNQWVRAYIEEHENCILYIYIYIYRVIYW
jgi:hypothetical protein